MIAYVFSYYLSQLSWGLGRFMCGATSWRPLRMWIVITSESWPWSAVKHRLETIPVQFIRMSMWICCYVASWTICCHVRILCCLFAYSSTYFLLFVRYGRTPCSSIYLRVHFSLMKKGQHPLSPNLWAVLYQPRGFSVYVYLILSWLPDLCWSIFVACSLSWVDFWLWRNLQGRSKMGKEYRNWSKACK